MKTTYYMNVLKCITEGRAPSKETVENLSVQELCDFSMLNKIPVLIAELLPYWKVKTEEEQNLVNDWKNEALHLVFEEHKKLQLVKRLLTESEKRRIPLLFFKGYLLAELYKNFTLRNSSDTDILVEKADFERTVLMLQDLNYRPASELDTKNVYTFLYEENGMQIHKIELHTSLYEDADGEELVQLNKLRMTATEHIISVNCCGMEIKTMRQTEHFIYQIFHMVKHFCCHGFPARYLMDTVLFVRKYGNQIDWENVDVAMEQLGYHKFYRHLMMILNRYFDLPVDNIWSSKKGYSTETMEELLQDILGFGARSFGEEVAGAFYYFETYVEKLEKKSRKKIEQIVFDGTLVPEKVVILLFQQSEKLQKRMNLLRKLELI